MTWVRRQADEPRSHQCDPPDLTARLQGNAIVYGDGAKVGDLWRCDHCRTLWVVHQPRQEINYFPPPEWSRAGWWLRLRNPAPTRSPAPMKTAPPPPPRTPMRGQRQVSGDLPPSQSQPSPPPPPPRTHHCCCDPDAHAEAIARLDAVMRPEHRIGNPAARQRPSTTPPA